MDKLGTYALVAALKEISKKSAPITDNERWISLRSCMKEVSAPNLDPPPPPSPVSAPAAHIAQATPAAAARPAVLSTTRPRRDFHYIRQIEMQHQQARRQTNGF